MTQFPTIKEERNMEDDWLIIGKIVSTQGLKGEVRVQSYSDFPERFQRPGMRWLRASETATPKETELLSGRNIPGKHSMYVVRLAGINTCEQAETLRNYLLAVKASDRPRLETNEYHVIDLIGCSVIHQPSHKYLGKVTNIVAAGNDLLEVQNEQNQTVLIPFVEAIAPIVNLEEKRIEVLPPDGLLDGFAY